MTLFMILCFQKKKRKRYEKSRFLDIFSFESMTISSDFKERLLCIKHFSFSMYLAA